jgi:cytochrome c oxidase cbb3-type subunit 2
MTRRFPVRTGPRVAKAFALALGGVLLWAAPVRAAGPDTGTDAQRQAGKTLYERNCSQCHGEQGNGQGPAAIHLRPMPRDFTSAKFKIRTTPNGCLPTHENLVNIIRRGMPYSSMPAWPNLTDQELSALAYYVMSFSPDFAKPELVPKQVDLPKGKAPTKESVEKGRKMYEDNGCLGCHGNQGRGDGSSAITLQDDWGHPIKPADLTQKWTFRGGGTREDIFRTLSTGLNGSPMPSYVDALNPEDRWALVDYIDSLSPATPDYASLVRVRAIDEPIDLQRAADQFKSAPVARLPMVGQIMEPGRSFHPPVVSIQVQAIHDSESLALRVRWNDIHADTQGHNAPDLPVPAAEELEAGIGTAPAAPAQGGGDVWGEAAAPAAKPAAPAAAPSGGGDVWGETAAPAGASGAGGAASEFSDAVAVQWPLQVSSGSRKPYFIFGDAADPVDLWFFDLAQKTPQQYVGKGSKSLTRNDTGELSAVASFTDGEWSVVYKWPLHPTTGVPFDEGQFVPVTFSVWDGFTRERGNRRALTVWYHLYVEPATVESPAGPMLKTAGFVLAAEILAIFAVRRSLTGKNSAV